MKNTPESGTHPTSVSSRDSGINQIRDSGINQIYGQIDGPVVILGFGSIGMGCIPLLERHFKYDPKRLVVIDPSDKNKAILDKHGIRFIQQALTPANYRDILTPLLGKNGFCINVTVDVGSLDIMKLCRELGSFYIDTVVEPWLGFYYDEKMDTSARSNYALREQMRAEKKRSPAGTTAISCCGANPGMVSWFVKQALLNVAADLKLPFTEPTTRAEWAKLMQQTGVKGIHIAERDTQRSKNPKKLGTFVNTWSVDGFISEGLQPAELGWGTHEKWLPETARRHKEGCQAALYMLQPGANTRIRSWCPTPKSQYAFLVTHNEAISIADYFTVGTGATPEYRPTCHYAYHPCNDAMLSLDEMFGQAGQMQKNHHILEEDEIEDGADELGVLLYGHAKNAYWYGSQLSIHETKKLAPYQNSTALQVTSAIMAGMAWTLENPNAGIVETDEIDFHRCLELQEPYLGKLKGYYTDWTPLAHRPGLFPEDIDTSDPWQFRNILVRS